MTPPWQIRTATSADLDLVEPLWVSQLLDQLERHLTNLGVDDLILGVLPGNRDAIRLYEGRGYPPTWMYLSRFHGR
jgi:GNAT superfamily N-acetyltransferase